MADDAPHKLTKDQFRRQLAAGDHAAFDLLIQRHEFSLRRFVQSHIPFRNSHDLEEIVQEILCRLWEHRTDIADTENLQALLYALARNVAIDHARRRDVRKHSELSEEIPSSSPSSVDVAYGEELEQRLNDSQGELTEAQRKALELKLAGLSAKEIAEQLGCSPKAVECRLAAAREHLRQHLSPGDDAT